MAPYAFSIDEGKCFYGPWSLWRAPLSDLIREIPTRVEAAGVHTIVTCNVDHTLLLTESPLLRKAYDGAAVRTVDGAPVAVVLGALARRRVHRCTGSDLLARGCTSRSWAGLTIAIVGSQPVVEEAVARLQPGSPARLVPMSFPQVDAVSAGEPSDVIAELNQLRPDITFLGLGSPKQEMWLEQNRDLLPNGVYICSGAAADFAAGVASRAPRFLRAIGLEWLYRLAREPRRLANRYLVRGPRFLFIAMRSLRSPL